MNLKRKRRYLLLVYRNVQPSGSKRSTFNIGPSTADFPSQKNKSLTFLLARDKASAVRFISMVAEGTKLDAEISSHCNEVSGISLIHSSSTNGVRFNFNVTSDLKTW